MTLIKAKAFCNKPFQNGSSNIYKQVSPTAFVSNKYKPTNLVLAIATRATAVSQVGN